MELPPFRHPSHLVLLCLQDSVKDWPLQIIIPQLVLNSVFCCLPPPLPPSSFSYPLYIPSFCTPASLCVCVCTCVYICNNYIITCVCCARNTVSRLDIYFEVSCMHFVDRVRRGLFTLVRWTPRHRKDRYHYYYYHHRSSSNRIHIDSALIMGTCCLLYGTA